MSGTGTSRAPADGHRPTIVVGVDGSAASGPVIAHAVVAAARHGADLEVVTSVAVELYSLGEALVAMPDIGEILDEARERVQALIAEVRTGDEVSVVPGADEVEIRLVLSERPPAPELVERSRDASLLVVGSRGRGAARSALLGSVALHCVTHAACPVVVVHGSPPAADRPPRVVVGVDGSPASRVALAAAVVEAGRIGAVVQAVTTYERADYWTELSWVVPPSVEETRERAANRARDLVEAVRTDDSGAGGAPEIVVEVLEGSAGEVLTEKSRGADLLVVGSRGRGAFRALLLGSVALHCVVHASCPVMVVRPLAEQAVARSAPAIAES